MKKLFTSLFVLFALSSFAQSPYNWAIGLRVGDPTGFTFKKSVAEMRYFEGILDLDNSGFLATALIEVNNPLLNEPGLSWFYGMGGHAGFWDSGSFDNPDNSYYAYGLDGILGLDYSFQGFPINISLDWKPAFNLVEYTYFDMTNGAISVRFKI